MNSALAALLKGHNTTISIAHRLSTIKRSDRIIVLGTDGKVAEQGTYKELSADPESAFSKLMEWQMNGGDAENASKVDTKAQITESDEIADDLARAQLLEAAEEEDDASAERKRNGTPAEVVAEKTSGSRF